MDRDYQFMVDFTLQKELTEEEKELLPYQKTMVQKYLSQGKLLNYAWSLDSSKAWAIFNASSIKEVLRMVIDFPLTKFTKYEISPLSQYEIQDYHADFSLN